MRILTLLLIIILSACATPRIEENVLPKTSQVGVVSLLGNQLEFEKRGLTVFANKTEQIDV
jgi:hypothetical protein